MKSFSADAYLNEMGITSPLFPEENTSSGMDVAKYDPVEDPEDEGEDVDAFADFMRSTKAPSRGPIDADVLAGETLFKSIGCNVCHVDTLYTSAPGTRINGGEFRVPDALGNKIFHPYSDFLLHDIGTGDGIPVQPTAGVCEHGEPDPHGAALGATHTQPAHARRAHVHGARGDPTSRRPGGVGEGEVQRALRSREAARVEVLGFAIAKVTAGVRSAE